MERASALCIPSRRVAYIAASHLDAARAFTTIPELLHASVSGVASHFDSVTATLVPFTNGGTNEVYLIARSPSRGVRARATLTAERLTRYHSRVSDAAMERFRGLGEPSEFSTRGIRAASAPIGVKTILRYAGSMSPLRGRSELATLIGAPIGAVPPPNAQRAPMEIAGLKAFIEGVIEAQQRTIAAVTQAERATVAEGRAHARESRDLAIPQAQLLGDL